GAIGQDMGSWCSPCPGPRAVHADPAHERASNKYFDGKPRQGEVRVAMQCPRCGGNTPGTLNGCAHCGAPVDQRPDPRTAQPGGAGSAPSLDVTMLDPQQPPVPQPPATPEAGLPPLDTPPPAPWAANMTMVDPLGKLS